ncbi:MAG: hypothetical protein GF335_02325 [Candidatus Moranbacteria bacterium]|nr:hypothetical protein [Candidatus Moranbacteria bacterium]
MTIQKILLQFEPKRKNLLSALHEVNKQFGYISNQNSYKICDYFSVSPSKLYSFITSSDVLRDQKPPLLEIKVCSGGVCKMKGADKVIKEIENFLKIKADKIYNGKVEFKKISCLGKCLVGPVVIINGTMYEKVNPSMVDDILKNYI